MTHFPVYTSDVKNAAWFILACTFAVLITAASVVFGIMHFKQETEVKPEPTNTVIQQQVNIECSTPGEMTAFLAANKQQLLVRGITDHYSQVVANVGIYANPQNASFSVVISHPAGSAACLVLTGILSE